VGAISADSSRQANGDVLIGMPGMFTDDELTALALAADPDQPLDSDAVPMSDYLSSEKVGLSGEKVGLLPEWYMAPVMTRHISRAPQLVVLIVIGAFLLIEAVGLCSTYGQLPFH
jgi:hypothetical protein